MSEEAERIAREVHQDRLRLWLKQNGKSLRTLGSRVKEYQCPTNN